MPNIWTHIMFCEEVLDSLNNPINLQDTQAYLNLGAQGPDPFFYHNYLPWKKDTRVNEVGSLLHTVSCGPFLIDLIKLGLTKSIKTKAYILGFVTHHILDRNTHPFIHYHAGYEGNNHQRLEVIIDTIMMEKYRNLNTWKVPVYKEIDVGTSLDIDIATTLENLINKYYKNDLRQLPTQYIQESYKQMKKALRILFDPSGWKNRLASSLISAYSHQPIRVHKDYLNEEGRTWYHPATNEPQNEGFLKAYERARNEGIELLTAIIKYWEAPLPELEQKVINLIGDISYDTGKPVSENLELRYSNPIV